MEHELPQLKRGRQGQGGYVLVAVVTLATVLLATGIAFMRWSTDETSQSKHAAAAMQAYYLGQMGVIEGGFTWLRTQLAAALPNSRIALNGREVDGYGRYENVEILPLISNGDPGSFWGQDRSFRITCVGVVSLPVRNGEVDDVKEVRRRVALYVKVRNFADYMYLSNYELTRPPTNDRIKFWHGDTLNGRVHSNDEIAIMQDPQFLDLVTQVPERFWIGSAYNPYFAIPPVFEAPPVEIPLVAENLRNCASGQGHLYDGGTAWTIRAIFTPGNCRMVRWATGTPYDSTVSWNVPTGGGDVCIFTETLLEVKGLVEGRVTIGSMYDMRLMDDIKYVDANLLGEVGEFSPNFLGLVSEHDIKIANTPENGRENSAGLGNAQTNRNLTTIVISAAIVALGESFTFENQNDPDSGYVCTPCGCLPNGGGARDDRGYIYLYGSLTQMRRGYVHRSTCTSTGYLKRYKYDRRLLARRPPGFFDAVDNSGHALFDVVQWGQGIDDQVDINNRNYTRIN